MTDRILMGCKINLLYWGAGPLIRNEKITSHKHDFCQLELSVSGTRVCKSGKKIFSFSTFESVFIPPGHAHAFSPHGSGGEYLYYSFKFRSSDGKLPPAPVKIPRDHFSEWVADNIIRYLGNEIGQLSYDPHAAEILESLIGNLLEHYCTKFVPQSPLPPFLEYFRVQIAQHGAQMSVKLAAEQTGLSVIQFRYRFKKEAANLPYEEKFASPGKFIDHLLLETACMHLKDSNLPAVSIAMLMGFNNNYTFSRFFRRMTGMTPLQYKKSNSRHNAV